MGEAGMTHRLSEAKLSELEHTADVYPHIGVREHVRLLRWAYTEIDRLQGQLDLVGSTETSH
jgi:hypothetical protein